jgi:plasmid stability protein
MDSKNYPSRLADKFMLRLDTGMRDELKIIAAKNRRSMNSEIIVRLAESMATEKVKASTGMLGS